MTDYAGQALLLPLQGKWLADGQLCGPKKKRKMYETAAFFLSCMHVFTLQENRTLIEILAVIG